MFAGRLRVVLVGLLAMTFSGSVLVQRLNAQVPYGSLTGTISDQSGAAIPDAAVTATNDETGLKRSTTADSTGRYRVLDLPQGTYTIDATIQGFSPTRRTGVNVRIGQVNEQNLQL